MGDLCPFLSSEKAIVEIKANKYNSKAYQDAKLNRSFVFQDL